MVSSSPLAQSGGPGSTSRALPRASGVLAHRGASWLTAHAELDHHCGVFLDYDTPKPFHIHTVLRTPHGNDYGRAWVREWRSRHDQVG